VTKVRLKGLKVYKRRGKWYVYLRSNGKALVQSFDGTREDLNKHLATPAILKIYGEVEMQPRRKGFGTLGGLFDFYKTKDKWKRLAPRTQADYQKVIDWLDEKDQLKTPVITIKQKHIVMTRDRAAADRYPKFSNDTLAVLSAAFKVGKMYNYAGIEANPVEGMERLHRNSKTANRRWTPDEWHQVWRIAPEHLRAVLALARWAGPRGQDIAVLRWDNVISIDRHGLFLEYTAQKNKEYVLTAVLPELETVLDSEKKTTLTICKNSRGRPYPSENAMRKAWQDFKLKKAFRDTCPTGTDLTLHGLRVTYTSELEELGFSDEDKAKAIGDKTAAMGKHYGRDAEKIHFALRVKNAKTA